MLSESLHSRGERQEINENISGIRYTRESRVVREGLCEEMTFRLERQGVSSAKTQRKSLLDRRNRKCKGPEAATGMVILRHSKEATKVEESNPK